MWDWRRADDIQLFQGFATLMAQAVKRLQVRDQMPVRLLTALRSGAA